MSISGKSFFSFPGLIIGLGLAIVFFKLYGPLTRPTVPTPVSATIDHFAPGVAIAKSVGEATKRVTALRWVDNVGYIGKPGGTTFDEVRLVPRRSRSGQLIADRDAQVETVEMVAFGRYGSNSYGNYYNIQPILRNLAVAFQTMDVKEGCLEPVGDGYPYRQ